MSKPSFEQVNVSFYKAVAMDTPMVLEI